MLSAAKRTLTRLIKTGREKRAKICRHFLTLQPMSKKLVEVDIEALKKFLNGRDLVVDTDFGFLPVDIDSLAKTFKREHKNTILIDERDLVCFITNIILK